MAEYHSGFACVVGRPNVGKSTLVNTLIGQDVAITSPTPQTTRHSIRGIVSQPDRQLVLVDTPGLHKPRTVLGKRLNELVRETWATVDVLVMCVPADQRVGPGDCFIASQLGRSAARGAATVAVVTKTDLADRDRTAEQLLEVSGLSEQIGRDWTEIIPVSVRSGENVETLKQVLLGLLPVGPQLYPEDEITDEPTATFIAEAIRHAAMQEMHDELPHSLAVQVESVTPRADRPETDPLTDVEATIFVERDSQKPIVLGRKGAGIRRIGTQARERIEPLLGTRVYLDLRVKVAKDWQKDPKQLRRLGF